MIAAGLSDTTAVGTTDATIAVMDEAPAATTVALATIASSGLTLTGAAGGVMEGRRPGNKPGMPGMNGGLPGTTGGIPGTTGGILGTTGGIAGAIAGTGGRPGNPAGIPGRGGRLGIASGGSPGTKGRLGTTGGTAMEGRVDTTGLTPGMAGFTTPGIPAIPGTPGSGKAGFGSHCRVAAHEGNPKGHAGSQGLKSGNGQYGRRDTASSKYAQL